MSVLAQLSSKYVNDSALKDISSCFASLLGTELTIHWKQHRKPCVVVMYLALQKLAMNSTEELIQIILHTSESLGFEKV